MIMSSANRDNYFFLSSLDSCVSCLLASTSSAVSTEIVRMGISALIASSEKLPVIPIDYCIRGIFINGFSYAE